MSNTTRETGPASGSRVMILTGCASGIGRHMAAVLVGQGHRLMLTDINVDAVKELVEEGGWDSNQVLVRKLDVRRAASWKATVKATIKAFGQVDVLMNIAGYLKPGYVHEFNLGEVDLHVDINLKGVIFGTQAAAVQMVAQGHGHIINVGSLASLAPVPGLSLYCASKFAVRGFSLSAAQELRPHGVFLSLFLPDAVETPMLDLQADYEEAAMTFSGTRPLTLADVEVAILERILPDRPLEVTMPAGRGRLAKLANFVPDVSMLIGPILVRKGRAAQQRIQVVVEPGE